MGLHIHSSLSTPVEIAGSGLPEPKPAGFRPDLSSSDVNGSFSAAFNGSRTGSLMQTKCPVKSDLHHVVEGEGAYVQMLCSLWAYVEQVDLLVRKKTVHIVVYSKQFELSRIISLHGKSVREAQEGKEASRRGSLLREREREKLEKGKKEAVTGEKAIRKGGRWSWEEAGVRYMELFNRFSF